MRGGRRGRLAVRAATAVLPILVVALAFIGPSVADGASWAAAEVADAGAFRTLAGAWWA